MRWSRDGDNDDEAGHDDDDDDDDDDDADGKYDRSYAAASSRLVH